jgi:hypothetical protein
MAEVVIGTDTETGETVTIADNDRRAGVYVLGLTGMGKSTLLINLQKRHCPPWVRSPPCDAGVTGRLGLATVMR